MTNIKRERLLQDDDDDDDDFQPSGYELKRVRHNTGSETQSNYGLSTTWDSEQDDEPLIRRNPARKLMPPTHSSEFDNDATTPEEADNLSRRDTSHSFLTNEMNEVGTSSRKVVHFPQPATPSPENEAVTGIQWPVLLDESELPSPEETDVYRAQLEAKIRELIGRGMKKATAVSYAPHLVRWQSYCDESCHGDYTVEAKKIVSFLNVKFFRGKPLLIEAGDTNNILIGRTEHNPLACPTEAIAEARLIRSRFEAALVMSGSTISERTFLLPHGVSTVRCAKTAVAKLHEYQNGLNGTEEDKPTSSAIVRDAINAYRDCLVFRYSSNGDKFGNGVEQETVLSKKQHVTQSTGSKAAPSKNQPKARIGGLPNSLVTKSTPTTLSQSVSNSGRHTNASSDAGQLGLKNLTQAMMYIWEARSKPVGHHPNLRNRAAVALERQMLLDCTKSLPMDLSDSFTECFDFKHQGSSCKATALALCLRSETPLADHATPVCIALRHKDHRICAVGALAFHMFDRFQLFGEDFPNFTDLREWSTIKLLRSMDRSKSATVNAVRFTMYVAFNAIEVHNSEQNQKNIAIRELSDLGVDISGPMVMGDTPLGVSALAGFHNEPYKLSRDVIPPLELQRQIFPMIESQHGGMDPAQWKAHCDRVMMDPLALPMSSSKPGEARTRRVAAAQVSKDAYLELTRKNFLTLLLWFRRIILQDGALFIRDGALNGCVSHAVFSTQEFEQFKTHLLKKMAKGQVPMPSQDRGSASNSHSAVQHDQKSSGTSSSRARSTRRGRERRRTGSRQRLLDEQSQEADKLPNNVLTDSNQDLHEADLEDNLAASQDLQQWIDQDCKQQKQAHRSLSDLLRREQEQKQKSRERELYRVQQNIEQERADVERRLGRLEQRYVQQSEDIQSLRRQMVQQDKNIQRLGAAHELKLQQFEVELATQADQIALQEERFQLLEEERDDWKQEQRKKTQRGLDQRSIERQLPDSPSFGGRGSSRQIGRGTGVATGLRAVPKVRQNDEARRVSEAISLIEWEREK